MASRSNRSRQGKNEQMLERQRKYAGSLVTNPSSDDGGNTGASEKIKDLTRKSMTAYLLKSDDPKTLLEIADPKSLWIKRADDAFSMTTAAIEQYTDAIHFYHQWEELYLFRAEAYRSRANLYEVPPGSESSRTAGRVLSKQKLTDLKMAISDVDHALRFWDPDFRDDYDRVPQMSINDAFTQQKRKRDNHFSVHYAKAWLLRGVIRASVNLELGNEGFKWEEDFETSKTLDPYDVSLYLAWGRAHWRLQDWEKALKQFNAFDEAGGAFEMWEAALQDEEQRRDDRVMKRTPEQMEFAKQIITAERDNLMTQKKQWMNRPQGGCTIL